MQFRLIPSLPQILSFSILLSVSSAEEARHCSLTVKHFSLLYYPGSYAIAWFAFLKWDCKPLPKRGCVGTLDPWGLA